MAGIHHREKYDKIRLELTNDDQPNLCEVKAGRLLLSSICVACDAKDTRLTDHPIIDSSLCVPCAADWAAHGLTFAADYSAFEYCVLCTNCGQMFTCDTPGCYLTYCYGCVRDLCGKKEPARLQDSQEEWRCFVCRGEAVGLLRPRPPDHTRALVLGLHHPWFVTPQHRPWSNIPQVSHEFPAISPRPLRVLSLFDGIGTGKVVLDKLKLSVEVYYASETEDDAIELARANHQLIHHVGDVKGLTKDMLETLGPIDLLIGGSPCNELSVANPNRRGLEGSGLLFFEYSRILNALQLLWRNHPLWWLYENVASMTDEQRVEISRFLECDPAEWNAKLFVSMNRKRYFWGNIPSMYYPPKAATKVLQIQDVLGSHRRASVKHMRCVTTNAASMLQGTGQKIHPVNMDGVPDTLRMMELEKLLGFPEHYTACTDLPKTRRQKLLGKTWSVHTVTAILRPLRFLFETTGEEEKLVLEEKVKETVETVQKEEEGEWEVEERGDVVLIDDDDEFVHVLSDEEGEEAQQRTTKGGKETDDAVQYVRLEISDEETEETVAANFVIVSDTEESGPIEANRAGKRDEHVKWGEENKENRRTKRRKFREQQQSNPICID